MAVPRIDFNIAGQNLLPPDQRKPYWIIFVTALLNPIARLYGLFTGFMNGETLIVWSSITTYAAGTKVFWNFKTWESVVSGNMGVIPGSNTAYWILRNNSFIGATERAKYNGRYLALTFALNRYFGTTFRQPPYPPPYGAGGAFSDIYITNVAPTFTSFVSYTKEAGGSTVYTIGTGNNEVFTTGIFAGASAYKFIINIPLAVYSALGATPAISDSIIRRFADKYVPCGITYNISTY